MAHGHRPFADDWSRSRSVLLPEEETMSHDQSQANLELALDRAERKAVRLTFARYVSAIQRVAERATSASARTGTSGARACPRRTEALSRRLPTCQTQVAHDGSKTIRGAIEAYVRVYTQLLACPRLCGGRRAFSEAGGDRIRERS